MDNISQDVTLDLDTLIDGVAVDIVESLSIDGDILFLPATVCMIDDRITSVSLDLRLACNRDRYTMIDANVTDQFDLVSNIRAADEYLTVVDLFGADQPTSHYLLREGGNGYLIYENGNRVLII